MKKFTWLLAAALPVVLFFSCQKEVASSAANRTPVTLSGGCSPNADPIPNGFFTLTTTPTNPVVGQPVQVCLSVMNGGMNKFIIWATQGTADESDDVTVASSTSGGGNVKSRCVTFTPTTANTCPTPANTVPAYRVEIQYNNGGGPNDPALCQKAVEELASISLCIPIGPGGDDNCDESAPLNIVGEVTNVVTAGGWSTISVTYTVTSCIDINGVRVQGGATAGGNLGVDFSSYTFHPTDVPDEDPDSYQSPGYPKELNSNLVLSWITNLKAGVSKQFSFTYTRSAITTCLTQVTGDWSAKADGVSDATAAKLQYCP